MSYAFKNNEHRRPLVPGRRQIAQAMAEIDYRQLDGRPGRQEVLRKGLVVGSRRGLFLKKRYGRRGCDGSLISDLDLRQRRNVLLHRLHATA